jgi:serine/threonine protein phosphatase PrpC
MANAGDSRAICSVKGEVVDLSRDHRPEDSGEATRVKNAGGYIEKGRVNGDLGMTRGLGDFCCKRNKYEKKENQVISAFPEVKKVRRDGVEFVFMGCDGLWERKSRAAMRNYIGEGLKDKEMDKVL